MQNISKLMQQLLHVWHDMAKSITNNAIGEWCVYLQACVCVCANDGTLSN